MATATAKKSRRLRSGHEFIKGTLSRPLLQFDLNSELDQLRQDDSWVKSAGRSSKTLVKHADLRIVLIAMKANTRMHEHTATARISVQSLSGHIRVHLPEQVVDLPAGHLLALDQCVPHDVEATEESAFLLTVSWPAAADIKECKTHPKSTSGRSRK
ncbi:MAG: cupin domain-containing protein [Candidatus Acidiferrales bacterium]